MKVLLINGSPRKNGNTATLLNNALEGAISRGAEVEIIHLYDLNFKGCTCCFRCKLKNSENYGKCAQKDDLIDVFEKIQTTDALILGSPVYGGSVSGEMSCFFERLATAWIAYDAANSSLFKKKIPTAFFYTMNSDEHIAEQMGYGQRFAVNTMIMSKIFGSSEALLVYDTQLFEDYSKYVADYFDTKSKAKRRAEVFPMDCQKAFEIGVKFAGPVLK